MRHFLERLFWPERFLSEPLIEDPWCEAALVTPPERTGILLVNLGTPDAPTRSAIRRFLAEFLSDPRVIEVPRYAWLPILHGIILNVRPGKISHNYESVWMPDGSPLLVYSRRQEAALRTLLAERGYDVEVELGMRYGSPALPDAIEALRARGCTRILTVPLYPQYSASTTATVVDRVASYAARLRNQPEMRFVQRFFDDRGYIDALASRVRSYWHEHGEAQKLVLSYHGLPQLSARLGDPYYRECIATSRLLTAALELPPERVETTFQSRFGPAAWLQPYTEPTLKLMAEQGVKSVDVFCPGFTADCLETLEEIAQGCKETFEGAGGKRLRYISAINDDPVWMSALADLVARHTQGWDKPKGH